MKKILALLFIAVVVLLVIGCKGEETAEETETTEETAETTAVTEEYDPEVVENLTTAFEEMSW